MKITKTTSKEDAAFLQFLLRDYNKKHSEFRRLVINKDFHGRQAGLLTPSNGCYNEYKKQNKDINIIIIRQRRNTTIHTCL